MKLFLEEFELNRLARRMQKGDRDAAEKLYAKLSDRVYGFCMNRVGNPHLAEDIMQDIFSLEKLNKEGKTIIMITHEPDIAEHAGRIIHLKDGRIVRDGNGHKRRLIGGKK